MRAARMRRWTPVTVTWMDAYTELGNTNAQAYIDAYKPVIRRTIGWFLARANGHVFVCSEDDRAKERGAADAITAIPADNVQSIEILEMKQ